MDTRTLALAIASDFVAPRISHNGHHKTATAALFVQFVETFNGNVLLNASLSDDGEVLEVRLPGSVTHQTPPPPLSIHLFHYSLVSSFPNDGHKQVEGLRLQIPTTEDASAFFTGAYNPAADAYDSALVALTHHVVKRFETRSQPRQAR